MLHAGAGRIPSCLRAPPPPTHTHTHPPTHPHPRWAGQQSNRSGCMACSMPRPGQVYPALCGGWRQACCCSCHLGREGRSPCRPIPQGKRTILCVLPLKHSRDKQSAVVLMLSLDAPPSCNCCRLDEFIPQDFAMQDFYMQHAPTSHFVTNLVVALQTPTVRLAWVTGFGAAWLHSQLSTGLLTRLEMALVVVQGKHWPGWGCGLKCGRPACYAGR